MGSAASAVDVVVVSYNSAETLTQAVRAAEAWLRTGRIVVVDNDSSDESVAVARRFDATVVACERNLGYGGGQNVGVAKTESEWVLLLNPDAEVDVDALEQGYLYASARAGVAMVEGSIQRASDGTVERWCGSEPGLAALVARLLRLRERIGEQRLKWFARMAGIDDYADREVTSPTEVEFLAAVAPLVRREAFSEIGGFDEQLFLYAEDIDLCRRLRNAGWSLVAMPDRWASHIGGASSAGHERRRAVLWWRSHRAFVKKHWTGPRRWAGIAVTALALWRERGPGGA